MNGRMAGPQMTFRTLEDVAVRHEDPQLLARNAKVSVMLAGASFGFEAAHVEALVALAEHIAVSEDPRVTGVLDRLSW